MSIGSMMSQLFGGAQPQAASQPAQPTPGNIPPQATAAMAAAPGNPNAPANSVPADGGQGQQNLQPEGLDKFNDLWKPVESPPGAGPDPMFNVKPEQLMEAARKIDFTKVIQPAQLDAIAQGGQGAVQAFAQALNTVAQTVYAQNAHATTKIVEQAVNKARDDFRASIPNEVRQLSVTDSLRSSNPALSHPAAAPILGALGQQLSVKYPNASPSEIQKMAGEYLSSFASAMNPPASQTDSQSSANSFDWDKYVAT